MKEASGHFTADMGDRHTELNELLEKVELMTKNQERGREFQRRSEGIAPRVKNISKEMHPLFMREYLDMSEAYMDQVEHLLNVYGV